ncbi:PREDICTED: egg cell-secreted protein 1.1-like [Camelina sativa]|uniref:Egg cell-secreted protein 1.1-like n=1 Tax=Camelina sativa TaxID=90675 RepID=A0ABM0X9R7_CAMSA|nr:PREDICTED: egg cell-secreted protein 1.1-like [Camelina sativa]XP_010482798.1 PREDICTED: egg cell-secreted protein 1.1-like [Camelina sativa]
MESKIKTLLSTILVVSTLCATTLVNPGLAQLPTIPGSPTDLAKCWSSLLKIQGCEVEIFKSALTGKFENVGPTCCKAFTEIDAKCWPKMFPLNPFFPPLLKDGCSHINAAAPSLATSKLSLIPGFSLPGSPVDITKCWSSLSSVEGCVAEIFKSVFTGKFGDVGHMCCKAFSDVDSKCWPHMFPLNPLFPPLLKDSCSRIEAAAPTHK